jgi:hypothetical protein
MEKEDQRVSPFSASVTALEMAATWQQWEMATTLIWPPRRGHCPQGEGGFFGQGLRDDFGVLRSLRMATPAPAPKAAGVTAGADWVCSGWPEGRR